MRKISKAELEKYRLLDHPIRNEVDYEKTIRAVRRLSPAVDDDGQELEQPADVAALQKALFDRVADYEKQEYPYGQPNFEEWSAGRTDEDYQKKAAEVEQAEKLVDRMEAFEQRRKARIRERLKAQGLKQQDLAQILKADVTYVSHLLAGRKQFSMQAVRRIHDKLGISFDDLIPPDEAFEVVTAEPTTARARTTRGRTAPEATVSERTARSKADTSRTASRTTATTLRKKKG